MKKIRNILFALPLALTFVFLSCSDNDIAGITGEKDDNRGYTVTGTIVNVAEFEEGAGEEGELRSKSQIYYDRVGKKLMFSWTKPDAADPKYDEKVDHIGIFAKDNASVHMDFKLNPSEDLIIKETTATGSFISTDPEVTSLTGDAVYYSYFPYKAVTLETGDFTYENVPISYKGQVQTANEQMGYYFKKTSDADALFLESEKRAAAHLGGYEYMVATGTASSESYLKFYYTHVGSILRFYMYCPSAASDNVFYDSLQVYNSEANFTINATLNIPGKTLTPTKTSHVISLGFHPALDMTVNNKHTTGTEYEKGISYYWKEDGSKGYIMAYMMAAPINLHDFTESPTLYLIGRQAAYYTYQEYKTAKGNNGITEEQFNALPKIDRMKIYENVTDYNTAKSTTLTAEEFATLPVSDKMKDYTRKFYKATLAKLKLEASKHHQWSVASAPADDPITFEEISIQEWEEGPGFTNEEGNGTEEW